VSQLAAATATNSLATTPVKFSSTLPRYLKKKKQARRLTTGLWLTQAHTYAMALAGLGLRPGEVDTELGETKRRHSHTDGNTLPSFSVDYCDDLPSHSSCNLNSYEIEGPLPNHTNTSIYLTCSKQHVLFFI
jgi:hypothetical protein